MSGVPVRLACVLPTASARKARGCHLHPAFPAPLCPRNLSECANGRLDQNRPLLELSPPRPKAREPVIERGTAPVSSSTRTVARAWSPNRARKGEWMMAQNDLVVVGIDVAKNKV